MDELLDLTTALASAIDPDARAAAINDALKPYDDENGPWRYAPKSEREKAINKLRDEQDEAAGESLYRLEHTARRLELELEPLERAAQEPPDPFTAWTRRANVAGLSVEANVSLSILAELQQSRIERDLASAKPSEIRLRYAAAQREPYSQENATLIRLIESQHGQGFRGNTEGDAREALQGAELQADIRAARLARIPDDITARRAAIHNAYRLADQAKARRVISRVPKAQA